MKETKFLKVIKKILLDDHRYDDRVLGIVITNREYTPTGWAVQYSLHLVNDKSEVKYRGIFISEFLDYLYDDEE